MTLRRFLQLDVFAHRPGAGNPLAVVLDADESAEHGRTRLDDQTMQAIACWTRLPETTFVFAPTQQGASYGVRIFSPRREVPFAGHPSVGTAHAVLESGFASPVDGILVQEGLVGLLPLAIQGDGDARRIAVRTPPSHLLETAAADDPRISGVLNGLPTGRLPPALMDGGRRWWLVEVSDEAALRHATPDWPAIGTLAQTTGSMGVCAFARAAAGSDYDLVVRAFVGAPGQFE
ncbi:MAG: PhzF family phenazine biosynthesis protein, partial [Pseudomonadota bacterium]|nr:PhzF family phenazine biosynthesis protein [Pseudomonadota bacterium]